MPCNNENHTHAWVTEGSLTIERCEKICGFCEAPFKHAWFLRRHVNNIHVKQYPNLKVDEGWSGSPNGNRRPGEPQKRRKGHVRNNSDSSNASFASSSLKNEVVFDETNEHEVSKHEAGPDNVSKHEGARDAVTKHNVTDDVNPGTVIETTEMKPAAETTIDNANLTADPFFTGWPNGLPVAADGQLPIYATGLFNGFDIDTKYDPLAGFFADPDPTYYPVDNIFITPQYVRTNGIIIGATQPIIDHHAAAKSFAEGLNTLIGDIHDSEHLYEEEVLYVLETFATAYKYGQKF